MSIVHIFKKKCDIKQETNYNEKYPSFQCTVRPVYEVAQRAHVDKAKLRIPRRDRKFTDVTVVSEEDIYLKPRNANPLFYIQQIQ